jgi:hypothetical protein
MTRNKQFFHGLGHEEMGEANGKIYDSTLLGKLMDVVAYLKIIQTSNKLKYA